MEERDFNKILGKISNFPGEDDFEHFVALVEQMMSMLDDADQDDYYGTEGWRHRVFAD